MWKRAMGEFGGSFVETQEARMRKSKLSRENVLEKRSCAHLQEREPLFADAFLELRREPHPSPSTRSAGSRACRKTDWGTPPAP